VSVAYDISDLEEWDARIRAAAAAFGLDCFPQEFEVCDHHAMLGYMAYAGLPSHYPHWSYGKAYEKLKTLYDHGVSGLPYEMVINANPALAYLMRDNSLLLQILTMAHVYGHNDFFKNNATFRSTRPEFTLATFKTHASRIRSYIEDPSIGLDRVEALLDAAHALSLQCRRNLAVRKRSADEVRDALLDSARPPADPFRTVHARRPTADPDLCKVPPEPDEDLLLFIRDHNPFFAEWERDVLTIVHEEARYFVPQIETKIMNEGWATYWHKRILERLDLPQGLHLEFLVRHNQVVRPIPGGLNPYHIGLHVWTALATRGDACLFAVRDADRDTSFLRRHLTADLMRELHLFSYASRGDDLVVREVADEDGWEAVKRTLLANVGMNGTPVIAVHDADVGRNRSLYLVHDHDGRDLQLEYAERTLAHVHRLWQRDVALETTLSGTRTVLSYTERGFTTKPLREPSAVSSQRSAAC